MLKTNRILYPNGIAVQAKKFAQPNDTRLVTVYRCEEAIHGLEDAVVRLAWKANQPMTPDHLHVVFDTDRELSNEEILRYDALRWTIECGFRQTKDQLKPGGTVFVIFGR
ncbi:hypothetical protein GsuE55_18580 [Geobacillus subterraneus]|uniref:Transposase IS4-like domain-containing protein n=1 Tax=Geobacillus subterraneus TaxID=129338 RepID=A0A679FQY6_9BACL|nr:hypothetical protein GsuE55_18580 [Geobacillus subterraneus]